AMEGIPVTHRGLSTELVFKIGSRAEGSVSGKTLVGYMSVEGLEEFLQRAVESGFSPETPAALISRGTCRGQRSVISTVGNLFKEAKRAAIRAPAVVVVGGVVGLRRWVGKQVRGRLAGQRVVLTVSKALGKGWREAFEKEGAEVWELPMTEMRNLKPKASWADQIAKTKWVVFTSGAGVRTLPGILGDLRKLTGKKIAVVGRSTATILQSIGLKADFVGPGPGAEALTKVWPGKKTDPVLHVTGSSENGRFTHILKKRGFRVGRVVAYQNAQPPRPSQAILNAFKQEGADWVVFASGTAAERFRRLVPKWAYEPKVAVIGPATVKVAKACGWNVRIVAREVSSQGVLAGILRS
ncbi:MAG: uroporphyrinogen-III synthase, partial [Verrucomicrobiota bacterium]